MKIQQIINELEAPHYEYVIAAYNHGRDEIEVYNTAKDAAKALDRLKQDFTCMDEIRLELTAKWHGKSVSTYYRFSGFEAARLEITETDVKAYLARRLAEGITGNELQQKEVFLRVGTPLTHKSEEASVTACLSCL